MAQIKTIKGFLEKELSYKILGAAMHVHSELGNGFLENVYQNALTIRMKEIGINVETQKQIKVYYHGKEVGHYIADLIIEKKIILELKTVRKINENHAAQLMNYLKACKIQIGYILNFANQKLEYRRFIY